MLSFHVRKEYWAEAKSLVRRYPQLEFEILPDYVIIIFKFEKQYSLDELVGIFSSLCAWSYFINGKKDQLNKAHKTVETLSKLLDLVRSIHA